MSAIVERLRAAMEAERKREWHGFNPPEGPYANVNAELNAVAVEIDRLTRDLEVSRQNYEIMHNSWKGLHDVTDGYRETIDRLTRERDARPTLVEIKACLGDWIRPVGGGAPVWRHAAQPDDVMGTLRSLYRRKAEQP